jgi:ubiquinone biosynthesis protein
VSISLSPQRVKRYAGVARLLYKYGRGDLIKEAGLETAIGPPPVEAVTPDRSHELADDLERLGPAYVKLGQLLSTRADLLPPAHLDALARLQDNVEPFPFTEVEQIVQDELGVRLSKGFHSFDKTPIAAASLGQVHRACLRDGRHVAIKVQRPSARAQVLADLEAFADIAEFLDRRTEIGRRLSFGEVIEEFRKTILDELDYRREAQNLVILGANLREFRRLVIPAPVDGYCSSRVLTMEYLPGRKVTSLNPVVRLDLDGRGLAEELLRAYLHQIIVDGFFHADPHPGNVFVTDDGRLALLDLGMVSRLSASRQEQLLTLVGAIADGRPEQACDVVLRIAVPLEDFDRAALERHVADLVARYRDSSAQDVRIGAVMLQIARLTGRYGVRMPPELTMLAKTLLNLDQVGHALDPDFDVQESIRRNATDLIRKRMRSSLSSSATFGALLELKQFVETLPSRLNRLFEAVVKNELRLKMEVIDEGALIDGLQKIANRVALGLLLSAMIVGAALLMRVPTSFTLFGYPGLAMLFFIGAAAGGIWLALAIVTGDTKRKRKLRA